ncbi:MAG: FHA domain-containing protein [Hyphomicrobiales bacterium]|nr:FHA domain-containing protein [Hyphomicrobiales bacterium]
MAQPGIAGAIGRIVLKLILPTVAILIALAFATTFDPQTVAERLEPSIVRVEVKGPEGSRSGTGFVISRGGYILTNSHVIEPHVAAGWELVVIENDAAGKNRLPATLIERVQEEDLAILHIEGLDRPPVVLSETGIDWPAKGMTVFAIGFPEVGGRLGEIHEASFTTGTVNRLFDGSWSKDGAELRIIQHSAPTNPGSSGGPIVNACGQVVGVNTQRELAIIIGPLGLPIVTDLIQGVFFASHASTVTKRLRGLGVAYTGSTKVCRELFGMASTNFPVMGAVAAILAILLFLAVLLVRPKFMIHVLSRHHGAARSGVRGIDACWRLTGQTSGGRAVDIVVTDTDLGRTNRGIVIGSDPLCDRPLRDPSVSYRHARLTTVDGVFAVSDMDSANGTRVDGIPIHPGTAPSPLSDGSQLILGDVTLDIKRFRSPR